MNSKDYWKRRSVQDMANRVNLTEDFINKKLKRYYNEALIDIEADIKSFYEKYAAQNDITYSAAKKAVSEADFSKVNFEELTDLARSTGDVVLQRQVNALSKKGQITRLEQLSLDINAKLAKLYDKEQISIYEYLADTYTDGYYKGIFNVQSYLSGGWSFTELSEAVITKAVTTSWSGKNFSDRIWGHRQKLDEDLQGVMANGFIRGLSIDKMTANVAKKTNVSYSNAKRLVRTEVNHIHNEATKQAYENYAGTERYVFMATLDFKTSEVCQELDGKDFATEDAKTGVNFPPVHPNCRSTTRPLLDPSIITERLAKGADGKYYSVPSNMTYKEWFNGLPQDERDKMLLERKKARNLYSDKQQLQKYKDVLGKDSPRSIAKFQDLKYTDSKGWEELKGKYRSENRALRTLADNKNPNNPIPASNKAEAAAGDKIPGGYKEVSEYVPLNLTPFKSHSMDVDLSRDTKFNLVNNTNACSKKGYEDLKDIREYASILDAGTGSPVNEAFKLIKGEKGKLELPDEAVSYLKTAKENSLILTHNHNNNSELSEADLKLFLKYPSVKIITAAADGQLFYLEKVDGMSYDVGEEQKALEELINNMDFYLKNHPDKVAKLEQYSDFKYTVYKAHYAKRNLIFRRW